MKPIYVMITLLTAAALTGCKTNLQPVDLMIVNGVIYSVDDQFSTADAMVINDGKIVALGAEQELKKSYEPVQLIDMNGMSIYPGFYDPHCHFYGYGAGLAAWADLTDTRSFDEVLVRIEEYASKTDGHWIAGRGWDENNWVEKRVPDNARLNELYPDRPVILVRVDGHAMIANATALELAGINMDTQIPGGEVQLSDGVPTGVLIDNACDLLREMYRDNAFSDETGQKLLIGGLLQGQDHCFSVGLTSVGDAGLSFDQMQQLEQLSAKGELVMNIYAMLNYSEENIAHYISKGIIQNENLHIRSVKFFLDGALGSRGALLLAPYSDKPESHGLLTLDTDSFRKYCAEILQYGYQVNTHAIGDSANRLVLDVYGEVLPEGNDLRWRIEHAQVIHPEDFIKFSRYNIIPAINAIHATSDMGWAETRLGSERIKGAYAYRRLLEANGWLPNGSDFPIEPINPLLGFYAAVTRQDAEGNPKGGWMPDQKLTRTEALRAMTIWAAKASFEENTKGSLEPGKKADFVVIDHDIMQIPENQLPEATVQQTWLNGRLVYEKL